MFNILKNFFILSFSHSLPVITLYYFYPWLFTAYGILLISLLVGLRVYYINYSATAALTKNLQFIPTGVYKDDFDLLTQSCGIDVGTVNLRYGYTQESVAQAFLNTVVIDPLVWHGIEHDPEVIKTLSVLDTHVVPTFSLDLKRRLEETKKLLTLPAQRFIFRHELGHVVNYYSHQKLVEMFLSAAITAYFAIHAALYAKLYVDGFFAIIIGLCTATLVNLALNFISNALFKYHHEYQADCFAAQFSAAEEINAAADFFEKHQILIDQARIQEGYLLSYVPNRALSGHPGGNARARYLRRLAKQCA